MSYRAKISEDFFLEAIGTFQEAQDTEFPQKVVKKHTVSEQNQEAFAVVRAA